MIQATQTKPVSQARRPKKRRLWLLLILLLALPLLVSWPLWHFAKNRLAEGLDDWVRQQETTGTQVRFQGPVTSGFPLAFDTQLTSLDIRRRDGWRWRSPRLQAKLDLTETDRLKLHLAPELLVDLPPEWKAEPFAFTAATPILGEALLGNPDMDFDVQLSGRGLELEAPSLTLMAGDAKLRIAARRDSGSSRGNHFFSLALKDIDVPPLPAVPLEGPIARSEVALRVLGDLAGTRRQDFAVWQAAGGEMELQGLLLLWQDLEIELADPTILRLDPNLQPFGELEFKARGLDGLLDRLETAGQIPSDQALGLRFLLLAMTRVEAGEAPYVLLPVSLRQGQVYLGPQLVARIPPLP